MSPQTFIFIGRSGCGKGTQAALLRTLLESREPEAQIFYIETGANFREFIEGEKYSNKLASQIYKSGERQPDFLAVWMWSHILIDSLGGTEHIIFDGITRSLPEAMTFTTAMEFYGRKPTVVYVNVSRKWSEERLLARGRADDMKPEEVAHRLDWFEKDTMPAVEYFNVHPLYTLLEVNGEQPIEKVHNDIVAKIALQ